MTVFWLLLTPFVSLFTFLRDWFHGFSISEIFNRRLDFIATNILVTSFLTGFRPLILFITHILTIPFIFIIGLFKPQVKKNYYEKKYNKTLKKTNSIRS